MSSEYYEFSPYIFSGETTLEVNGYRIQKPSRFRNLAHERAFEIALVLARKKPSYSYSQRMGDIIITKSSPIIMTTSECIDVITFNGIPEIRLKLDVVNPNKVAFDAMNLVPSLFDPGVVRLGQAKKLRRMWYLEIEKIN